jgi:FkbM family methyltransferase
LSYKRALIRLLDRAGGRFLLGRIATRAVRRVAKSDIEISYIEGLWTRRAGRYFFPDGRKFEYGYADFESWKRQAEIYAADTREYWLQHYRPQKGDVIVDVGAGRGEDTLTFSRAVGETGRVIAIEAHPLSFAILKNFCKLNGLNNVTALHLALMDNPGTVQMAASGSTWMENAVSKDSEVAGISVPAGTLDELCKAEALNKIAFLKMNIEGAEREALLGMEQTLRHVNQICVACHDFRSDLGHGERFRTRDFVEQFLVRHGFRLFGRADDPRDYVRDHVFGLRIE